MNRGVMSAVLSQCELQPGWSSCALSVESSSTLRWWIRRRSLITVTASFTALCYSLYWQGDTQHTVGLWCSPSCSDLCCMWWSLETPADVFPVFQLLQIHFVPQQINGANCCEAAAAPLISLSHWWQINSEWMFEHDTCSSLSTVFLLLDGNGQFSMCWSNTKMVELLWKLQSASDEGWWTFSC